MAVREVGDELCCWLVRAAMGFPFLLSGSDCCTFEVEVQE
ncbi:hypothetical protein SLEP1_g1245 [Rubroshorea leprosula]|uniref:Uncharacterized protein n=1 Tax=Rubroshorea leprosula TaxID=152421 RepID=A0AAV5HLJ0_9ROSI|nr:hypothetical protein SLEP1_g1245 [Rubroshorea leprosula]